MADEEHEGELALKKRREQVSEGGGLDDTDKELLTQNRAERDRMTEEIHELRERSERRKKEREEEDKRLASERQAEEARRKAEEEERKRKKEEDEQKRYAARLQKAKEFEKWKNPPKANFVISKRERDDEEGEATEEGGAGRKSKEQLDAEKKAILSQRIKPLSTEGDQAKNAKDLHKDIARLIGEIYDLERRYKYSQVQLTDLAERARQATKVGEGLKRVQTGNEESVDKIQQRFAGAPLKVEMYSKYERQKDKRSYDERHTLYTGPQYAYPVERIQPKKIVAWDEDGLPIYSGSG